MLFLLRLVELCHQGVKLLSNISMHRTNPDLDGSRNDLDMYTIPWKKIFVMRIGFFTFVQSYYDHD